MLVAWGRSEILAGNPGEARRKFCEARATQVGHGVSTDHTAFATSNGITTLLCVAHNDCMLNAVPHVCAAQTLTCSITAAALPHGCPFCARNASAFRLLASMRSSCSAVSPGTGEPP